MPAFMSTEERVSSVITCHAACRISAYHEVTGKQPASHMCKVQTATASGSAIPNDGMVPKKYPLRACSVIPKTHGLDGIGKK
jgi:hypothetical protein